MTGLLAPLKPIFKMETNAAERVLKIGAEKTKCADPFTVSVYTSTVKERKWINRYVPPLDKTKVNLTKLMPRKRLPEDES